MVDESAYVDTSILGAYYCPEPRKRSRGKGTATIQDSGHQRSERSRVLLPDLEEVPAG